ncbi:MAG: hypothetical protein GY729_20380 [Desulfobacteraceae bacterium]|nr:hypothetical protein [Desulfobacteraceae bacterium]
MKKSIILHIGPHKTGTTAFQQTIRRSPEALKEEGVFICPPKTIVPGKGGYHIIPREIRNNNKSETLDEVLKCYEETDCHRAIISSEGFDRFQKKEIVELSNTLDKYEVEVYVVLRHPISLITSFYCSAGGFLRLRAPDQYFESFLKGESFIYFGKFIAKWQKSFPNIKVLFYEDEDDIVAYLLRKMNFSPDLFNKIMLRRPNSSPQGNCLEDFIKDGRARISLSPALSIVNYLLREELQKAEHVRQAAIHRELLRFDITYRKNGLPRLKNKGRILLSKDEQSEILARLSDEISAVADLTGKEVPQSYYLPIDGAVPKPKELQRLYNSFISNSRHVTDKSKKIIRLLPGPNPKLKLLPRPPGLWKFLPYSIYEKVRKLKVYVLNIKNH